MTPSAAQPAKPNDLSQRYRQTQCWEQIRVQHFQHPAGECSCPESDDLTISLSLAPRPVHMMQSQARKTYVGVYQRGDITITPAKTPFFARWKSDDSFLQIRLTDQLIRAVAAETLEQDPDRLELLPELQIRNPQIESVGTLLLTELQQPHVVSSLYIDALT